MIKALAAAKINLYLDVLRRREDGYHDIETLYQPVSLWDELTFEKAPAGIEVVGDDASIPWNEENLCHRAAKLILESSGTKGGVRIGVTKGIPSGAGLGGGSSDAAATLLAVNELLHCGFSNDELRKLSLALGSDVPFFIFGSPAIGRGRGELLEGAPGLRGGWILIVKPDVTVSTSWAYQNFNLILTRGEGRATLTTLLEGIQRFPAVRLETRNSFEAGVVEHYPGVSGILSALRDEKPVLSSLSGSGSACFAVFEVESRAREVGERFNSEGLFTRLVQPVEQAIHISGTERSS
ncbi:MAG: 4-(cytidine 5'-diphospho)-2-C-methyl-D-erythritol kinase [Candidatus Krumholzibacteria bacterium]|nr:4-(cytidine 5'-diphospho)-2-C-methyl-D-erythritol kinase [Candidatus Krumholzibacteria bacterium]